MFSVLTIALFLSSTTNAATTDFVADGNVTVSSVVYNSLTADLLIMDGSKAESWNFNSDNFTVTNPDTSGFTVGSNNSAVKSIRVKSHNENRETTCADNTTAGTSYVTLPITADTYSVYPSSSTCEVAASGGGSSGGGGGSRTRTPPVAPVTPATPAATPAVPGVVPAIPASLALARASVNASFNRLLNVGLVDEDVRNLQRFLNSNGFVVAPAGPGAPGEETNYFGALTRAAVVKFQLANEVIQTTTDEGAGQVGPRTRTKLNELSNISVIQLQPVSDVGKQELIRSLTQQLQVLQAQLQALLEVNN